MCYGFHCKLIITQKKVFWLSQLTFFSLWAFFTAPFCWSLNLWKSHHALVILFDFRQLAHTWRVLGVPSTIALTVRMLGFHILLERLWEWLTLIPKCAPFWQISHLAMLAPPYLFWNGLCKKLLFEHSIIHFSRWISAFQVLLEKNIWFFQYGLQAMDFLL